MSTYFVIFGAMVRPDGTASGTLQRRVEGALANASGVADPRFLATGGQGRHGTPEADVMAEILIRHGVEDDLILREGASTDTLSSARECAALLNGLDDVERVLVCSSPYHNPRCALLLRMFGIPAHIPPMPGDREALGWLKWLYYVFREFSATPYDAVLVLFQR